MLGGRASDGAMTLPHWARLLRRLPEALTAISMAAMALMAVHITASVCRRVLFGSELPGTLEMVMYIYMIILTFFPLALLQLNNSHIAADLLTQAYPPRLRKWMSIVFEIVGLLFLLALAYCTYLSAYERMMQGESIITGTGYFSTWQSRWVLPIGLGIGAMAAVIRIIELASGRPERPREEVML